MLKFLNKILSTLLFFLPQSLITNLRFETVAYCGRLCSRPLILKLGKNYVNLGSGTKNVKGFINIDFFTAPGIDYGADLRYPLKIPNNSIDGIFCEHTLEHLTYNQADALLKESHRILKPGATIRIVVPDLSLFIMNYHENNSEWFSKWEYLMFQSSRDEARKKRRLASNLEAISFVTQEYGHVSCWDVKTLSTYLTNNKFKEITQCSFMQGSDEKLLIDQNEEARKFVSLYLEAMKSDGDRP